jgi:hypothetical protein
MENDDSKTNSQHCDCNEPFVGVGQNVLNMSGGVVVIASTVCTKCGRVNVDITQIPFVMPEKQVEKQDIILPDPNAKKRLFNEQKIMNQKLILLIIIEIIISFIFLSLGYLWGMLYIDKITDIQKQEQIRLLEKVKSKESTVIKKEDTAQHKIYQYIRMKESTNGKYGLAVTCAKKGMVNEVGWRNREGFCFNSQEDQEITVKQWLTKKITIDGMTVDEALFIYSGGDYSKFNG